MIDRGAIQSIAPRGRFVGEPMTTRFKSLARILGKPIHRPGEGRTEFSAWTGADGLARNFSMTLGPAEED